MGRAFKRWGKQRRAMLHVFMDYAKRSQALYLEYALEFKDNALAQPTWRSLGVDATFDPVVAEKARRDYLAAFSGYDVEVRIVARYVNPSWMVMTGWPLVKRRCTECNAEITVNPDLRLVDHGVLVSHVVDPLSGKVQRTSRPCAGSGSEV